MTNVVAMPPCVISKRNGPGLVISLLVHVETPLYGSVRLVLAANQRLSNVWSTLDKGSQSAVMQLFKEG